MLTDSGDSRYLACAMLCNVANEVKERRGCSPHFKKTLLKITEEGAWFRSCIDGARQSVTPEISIQTQRSLGADLILSFDDQILLHKT